MTENQEKLKEKEEKRKSGWKGEIEVRKQKKKRGNQNDLYKSNGESWLEEKVDTFSQNERLNWLIINYLFTKKQE